MATSSLLSASAASPVAGETPSGTEAPLLPQDWGKVPLWRSGFVLFLAAAVGMAYWLNPPVNIQPQAGVVMELPVIVGDYYGKLGEISQAELIILPKDTEFARRVYEDGRGHQINCSIVLSGAEQRSIHRPEVCLVGQGWTIIGQDNIPIPLRSGHKLEGRRLTLQRQAVGPNGDPLMIRAFYVYWFVGQNVATPSSFTRVFLSSWDRAIHNRSHRWAYVSLFSLITENLGPGGLNAEQTTATLVDFSTQIVPTFQISEMPPNSSNLN